MYGGGGNSFWLSELQFSRVFRVWAGLETTAAAQRLEVRSTVKIESERDCARSLVAFTGKER